MDNHRKKLPKSAADTAQNLHSQVRLASIQGRFQAKRQAELLNNDPPSFYLPQQLNQIKPDNYEYYSPLPKTQAQYPILSSLQKANDYSNFYSPYTHFYSPQPQPLLTVMPENPAGFQKPFPPTDPYISNFNALCLDYHNNMGGTFLPTANNPIEEPFLPTPPSKNKLGFNKENWNGRDFLPPKNTPLIPSNHKDNYIVHDPRRIVVKSYEFIKSRETFLGSGTFSEVYLGNAIANKQEKVAIKVINTSKCNSLIGEIYITQSINSQNVVSILDYDFCSEQNLCYIVLEFCNQGSLDSHKAQQNTDLSNTPKLKMLYNFFQQLLRGLRALYDQNVIHRDLKLSNILLKDGVVKIADFGFAKHIGNYSQVNSIKCGTPSTMAPEIVLENNTYVTFNKKSDIWSLGVMLHELVYGIHPFDMNADHMQRGKRVRLSVAYPLAEDFIEKALKYDISQRMSWDEVFSHPINFIDEDSVYDRRNREGMLYQKEMLSNHKRFEEQEAWGVNRREKHHIRTYDKKRRNNESLDNQKVILVVMVVCLVALIIYRMLMD